ncbi:MAG TPA: SulP family inorganic anion transporter [Acidimicrobiales bacterium]|nr:SulP family inorganic anion transporter [Acidimicrobiales bacterium]
MAVAQHKPRDRDPARRGGRARGGRARQAWRRRLGRLLVPPTFRGYRAGWLGADALGGLALVAVALPSQMATARLAGLPPVLGLYAFVAGSLCYALIGTNSHLSVGADSTIAPVLATGVASVGLAGAGDDAAAMAFLALAVGAVLVAVGSLRLGWLADLLSTPVITGILAGIGVEIVARQLATVLGLPGGGTTTIGRVRLVVDHLGRTNGWSLAIALGVLVIVTVARRVDARIPGTLIALVLSVAAVELFRLGSAHGVAVVGVVHGGLPRLRVPRTYWSQLRRLSPTIVTVAFVCVAQTAATVRETRAASSRAGDFDRDLVAVGAGSLAAALAGTLAVDASPPNTAVLESSPARSQLANLAAAAAVLCVAAVATAPLEHLPAAMLGATLLVIAAKLFHVRQLRAILHFDRVEFLLALAALVTVALVGIEQGVALAVLLSLADRIRRAARPRDAVLGREPGTDHWIPTDVGSVTEQVPGILVYLVYSALWYGNADHVRLRLGELVDGADEPLRAVILDADAMSDIDYTGLQALRALAIDLESRGVTLQIARASHLVHHDLKHGDLLARIGSDHLFTSVADAVTACGRPAGQGGRS